MTPVPGTPPADSQTGSEWNHQLVCWPLTARTSLPLISPSQSVSQSDETRLVSVKDSQLNWLLLYYWPPLPPRPPPPRLISRVLGGESAGGAWL